MATKPPPQIKLLKAAGQQLEHWQQEDAEVQRKQYHGVYPSVRGGVPVDIDTSPTDFREQFLAYVAKRISWYFIGHPTTDTYMDDTPRE